MVNYNLGVLNDKEFEELCRELLQAEHGLFFQSFKSGRDKGIDFRYSTDEDNKIVVQVKHYFKSGYSSLKSHLKKTELPKVKSLNPKRYIIATSVELNPMEVEEIKEIFDGYIHSLSDIYWLQSINSLLSKFPDIEKKFFKLWLSSTNTISYILNSNAYFKATLLEREIIAKVSLYVPISEHEKAYNLLLSKRVVLITGAPGVGKTTLSDMLIYRALGDLKCELIVIDSLIDEAEKVLSLEDDKKQLVFFDDFLGANIYEILNPKNNEGKLVKFVNRIRMLKNKYLILATRTTILNQALDWSEKFRNSKVSDLFRFEVNLKDYTPLEKAKILYNHIYFGDLEDIFKKQIIRDRNYLKIVEHKNFNPRIIKFLTTPIYFNKVNSDNYSNYIFDTLNNPEEIWRGSYEQQLYDEDRFMLTTLFTLRGSASKNLLEQIFEERLRYEVETNGFVVKTDVFNKSLKRLLDGYLNSVINNLFGGLLGSMFSSLFTPENNEPNISFSNPSIGDFLFNYLRNSSFEKKRVLYSIRSVEQLLNVFHPSRKEYLSFSKEELREYYHYFKRNKENFKCINNSKTLELEKMNLHLIYFSEFNLEEDLGEYINNEEWLKISSAQCLTLIHLLENIINYPLLVGLVKENWDIIIGKLYVNTSLEDEFSRVRKLFDLYKVSYSDYLEKDSNRYLIEKQLSEYFCQAIEEEISNADYTSYEFDEETLYFSDYGSGEDDSVEIQFVLRNDLECEGYDMLSTLMSDSDFINEEDKFDITLNISFDALRENIENGYQEHIADMDVPKDDDIEDIQSIDYIPIIDNLFEGE